MPRASAAEWQWHTPGGSRDDRSAQTSAEVRDSSGKSEELLPICSKI